jgi:regulator of sigma E protease
MVILTKALQLILSLSILVLLHEFGHFIFARIFKTRVEKFYLFFDPWFSLFKVKKGDTEYGVGWLPLGGYVKISGMIDESMDVEQMKQPAQPWEFRAKPAWQRLLIMLGGVLVNFILALIIYAGVLFVWGEDYLPTKNMKYGIAADSLALQAGLQSGDHVLAVDGKTIGNYAEISLAVILNQAKTITVKRDTQIININLSPDLVAKLIRQKGFISVRIPFIANDFTKDSPAKAAGMQTGDRILAINGDSAKFFDEFRQKISSYKNQEVTVLVDRSGQPVQFKIKVSETGLIGVYPDGNLSKFFTLEHTSYGFFNAIPAGISKGFQTIGDYIKQLKLIFSPKAKGYEQLGSFLTIGSIFPGVWDWQSFWSLTAFLSIILAIMNILPIPALDGGHVLFLLYEIITGRKPGDKFMEYAQISGMVILIALMLYANMNDVLRFFFKH